MKTTKHASIKSEGDNVGIDVGKDYFDICVYEQDFDWQESNTEIGIRRLMKRLSRYHVNRLLVEATGGYERALVEAAIDHSIPVVIVQPIQVRQFAKAQGVFAKTDKIDARLIAEYGVKLQPEVKALPGVLHTTVNFIEKTKPLISYDEWRKYSTEHSLVPSWDDRFMIQQFGVAV